MKVEIIHDGSVINEDVDITASEVYLRSKSTISYGWFVSDDFILPFVVDKRFIFKRLIITHETILKKGRTYSQCKEIDFLNSVCHESKRLNIHLIYQPYTNVVFQVYPKDSIFCHFGSYIVNLEMPEDKLLANLHVKHRNVIKKAIKDGVQILEGKSQKDVCYSLIKQTMQRQGMSFIKYEQFQQEYVLLGNNITYYVAYYNGIPQGGAVIVFKEGFSAYYMHGGSITKPYTGSLNYMHWQIMLDMKKIGVRNYDFVGARINPQEGSKLESIQRFKSRFGTVLKSGFLWKYPTNPWMYKMYYFVAKLYYKYMSEEYSGDIIDDENARNSE